MPSDDFPPMPATNFTAHHAVTVPVDLTTAYTKLGRCEHLRDVIGLSPVAQNIEISAIEPIASSSNSVRSLENIYNLSPSNDTVDGAPLRRAKFSFREAMTYVGFVNVNVDLIGSHIEPTNPAFDNDTPITVLYESYSKTQSVWVRKRRTFTRIGEKETRVEETVDGACSRWLVKVVQRECRNAHQGHMLTFGKLFEGGVEAKEVSV